MKKYYSFETAFISLRDELRRFLKEHGFYYELSGAFGFYHFEILLAPAEVQKVNDFLDSVTITERKEK